MSGNVAHAPRQLYLMTFSPGQGGILPVSAVLVGVRQSPRTLSQYSQQCKSEPWPSGNPFGAWPYTHPCTAFAGTLNCECPCPVHKVLFESGISANASKIAMLFVSHTQHSACQCMRLGLLQSHSCAQNERQ